MRVLHAFPFGGAGSTPGAFSPGAAAGGGVAPGRAPGAFGGTPGDGTVGMGVAVGTGVAVGLGVAAARGGNDRERNESGDYESPLSWVHECVSLLGMNSWR